MLTLRSVSIVTGLLLLPPMLFAVDGVVLINQTNALAGNVTPGDTPGFPVTITQPGSYRLSSNLNLGYPGAIDIESDNVTIDLNGFSIIGGGICYVDVNGVFTCEGLGGAGIFTTSSAGYSNITIRNGFIVNIYGAAAIYCPPCNDVLVDHIQFNSDSESVNVVNGTNVVIRDCVMTNTGGLYISNGVTEGVVLGANAIGMGGTSLTVRDSVFISNHAPSFSSGQIVGFSGDSFLLESAPASGFSLGQNTLGGIIW